MSNDPVNLYDYEERAKLTLPHNDWDTIWSFGHYVGDGDLSTDKDRGFLLGGGRHDYAHRPP